MAKRKPKTQHMLVNFELESDQRCVALAQLGMSSAFISEETGLSGSQIYYRLTKAKKAEGYEAGHTYRSEWKNGSSFAARTVINSLGQQLKADAERRLPKLFVKATARISPEGQH